jgi:hypothetical protein
VFTARETKERIPSLCAAEVKKGAGGGLTKQYHTTAFTIAVRSAQIVPPVTKTYINLVTVIHISFTNPEHTIRCVLYVRTLDYLAIWGQEGRTDAKFRIRRI